LDDRSFFGAPGTSGPMNVDSMAGPSTHAQPPHHNAMNQNSYQAHDSSLHHSQSIPPHLSSHQQRLPPPDQDFNHALSPTVSKTEQFFMTAANQSSGTRDERLAKVIHAKYEAGLLKPYNYVTEYKRLSNWMERR
jgi:hypothetical protein